MSDKRTKGFWQFWTCPKCKETRSTYRMGKSEGRTVQTYCSQRCQSSPVFVVRRGSHGMTTPPLLSDREIADRSASFTANLPVLKRSGWTTSDHRCGMELARSIYESDRDRLLAEIERLTPWAKMGAWALETSREEMGDLDGGEIQDAALAFGLLHEVDVTGPCCDECRCSEYDDFPQKCLRIKIPFKPIPLPEKGSE